MRKERAVVVLAMLLLLMPLSSSTCEWDYPIWIPRSPSADALYRFTKGDKAGYLDQTGKIVIPLSIPYWGGNWSGEFHDGLVKVGITEPDYFDKLGKKITFDGWFNISDFSEGLAAAMKTSDGQWGYINTKGEFVISPHFASSSADHVSSFVNGFAAIEVHGKYGFIDRSGEFAIPPRFLLADAFHDDMARVVAEGPCFYVDPTPCSNPAILPHGTTTSALVPECKFTFIDSAGRIISQDRFERAGSFAEGLAPVRVGDHWGYLEKHGNLAIPARFDTAEPFSDGLALVSKDEHFGYIDHSGAFAIAPQFRHAEPFSNERAVVSDGDDLYWYIDKQGKPTFSEKFEEASSFFKGLAHVELVPTETNAKDKAAVDGPYAYIDVSGKHVFTYKP
jgi:hypothetical protein